MTEFLTGRIPLRRLVVPVLLIQFGWLAGCGPKASEPPKTPPTFPITGVIHIDGKPVPGVKVMLFPGKEEIKVYDPNQGSAHQGTTDDTGKFSITSYFANDGAPVGEYQVLLYWPGNKPVGMGGDPDAPQALDPAATRFNKKYSDQRKPFQTIKVEDGKPLDLGTLDLKTK